MVGKLREQEVEASTHIKIQSRELQPEHGAIASGWVSSSQVTQPRQTFTELPISQAILHSWFIHDSVYQAENIQHYTGKSQQCRNPIHLHRVASHLITRVGFTCCNEWIHNGHAVTRSCIRRLLLCFPTAQTQIIMYSLQHCLDCYLRLFVTNSLHLILAHFY